MNNTALPLNVLLTKKCNADCKFCIEKTKESVADRMAWRDFASIINKMIELDLVQDILLLGGEPLYYQNIIELVKALKVPPIITTNAHRIVRDKKFLNDFKKLKLKALNISIPHYDDNKRAELMGCHLFSKFELKETLKDVSFPLRINTPLIKNYIESIADIERMSAFCSEIGVSELKVAELSATNPNIHDFISDRVIKFNSANKVEIPDEKLRNKCHKIGGTNLWKTMRGIKIFFNSPPDIAMNGGMDENGNYYHRILFNDGLIGHSWRRQDGLVPLSVFLHK